MVSLRKPWLNSRAAGIAVTITCAAVLGVHSMAAAVFYATNSASLQIVAENAVRTAAEYLPKEPTVAVRIADNYAETGGIAPYEIVLTRVAGDDRAITLSLRRKVPGYVAFLALGLPSREIRVTVSARRGGFGTLSEFSSDTSARSIWQVIYVKGAFSGFDA